MGDWTRVTFRLVLAFLRHPSFHSLDACCIIPGPATSAYAGFYFAVEAPALEPAFGKLVHGTWWGRVWSLDLLLVTHQMWVLVSFRWLPYTFQALHIRRRVSHGAGGVCNFVLLFACFL